MSEKAARAALAVLGVKCLRCQHQWIRKTPQKPRVCPKCKSPYWDRPRKG